MPLQVDRQLSWKESLKKVHCICLLKNRESSLVFYYCSVWSKEVLVISLFKIAFHLDKCKWLFLGTTSLLKFVRTFAVYFAILFWRLCFYWPLYKQSDQFAAHLWYLHWIMKTVWKYLVSNHTVKYCKWKYCKDHFSLSTLTIYFSYDPSFTYTVCHNFCGIMRFLVECIFMYVLNCFFT